MAALFHPTSRGNHFSFRRAAPAAPHSLAMPYRVARVRRQESEVAKRATDDIAVFIRSVIAEGEVIASTPSLHVVSVPYGGRLAAVWCACMLSRVFCQWRPRSESCGLYMTWTRDVSDEEDLALTWRNTFGFASKSAPLVIKIAAGAGGDPTDAQRSCAQAVDHRRYLRNLIAWIGEYLRDVYSGWVYVPMGNGTETLALEYEVGPRATSTIEINFEWKTFRREQWTPFKLVKIVPRGDDWWQAAVIVVNKHYGNDSALIARSRHSAKFRSHEALGYKIPYNAVSSHISPTHTCFVLSPPPAGDPVWGSTRSVRSNDGVASISSTAVVLDQ